MPKFSYLLPFLALLAAHPGVGQTRKPPKAVVQPSKVAPLPAPMNTQTALYQQILAVDGQLFQAFNTCDSLTYRTFIADDLEFYHDAGGLNVSLANEMVTFRQMCARGTHLRRELLANTLEVHPIKNYGAVEIGAHRFYHTNPGQPEKLSGTYKFVHVWHYLNGQWKLARVISYGHEGMRND
jgi:hypothetical protein